MSTPATSASGTASVASPPFSSAPVSAGPSSATRGALAAGGCFVLWGLFPVFWKQMQGIPATELICHRIVWSLLFLFAVLAWQGTLRGTFAVFANTRLVALNALSSVLLACNWLIFVWGVNNNHVVECSLGYFLTPLCNVALGCAFLRERLSRLQWSAIVLAGIGVAILLLRLGHIPWIAFGLAGSWSLYGILKKQSALGALASLTVETLLLFPLAAGWLVWLALRGDGALGHVNLAQHGWLLSVGLVTAVPLLLFGWGARRLRLTTMGLLLYINPTLQFLIGLFVYHETLETPQLWAFACIWAGLIVYTADSFLASRQVSGSPHRAR
ncbi:membrane protein [Opitutaceae bacterium TAV5]|nr:membrane protein [Opitutaceae bacterium TAV5]